MKNLLLSLLILLTGTLFSYGQFSVKGIVVDSTNAPVDYVNIIVFQKDTVFNDQSITDVSGKFELSLPKGSYTLKFIWFGEIVSTSDISITNNLDLGKITIKNSLTLGEFTVSAERKIIEKEYDKLIFNVEDSPLKEGYNGLEVLQRTPRVQVNTSGDILIKRSPPLVLINGKELKLSGVELNNYLNSLNSNQIEKIEIQNIGSANTSASNTGGVINIITKKPHQGVLAYLDGGYAYKGDNYYKHAESISLIYTASKFNWYGKYRYNEGKDLAEFETTTSFNSTNGRNHSEGEFTDYSNGSTFQTGGIYNINPHHEIGLEYYNTSNNRNINSDDSLKVYAPELSSISYNLTNSRNTSDLWYAALNYTFKIDSLGSKLKVQAETGNQNIGDLNTINTRYTLGNSPNSGTRFTTDNASNYYTAQVDWNKKFKSSAELELGAKFNSIDRENKLLQEELDSGWTEVPSGNDDFNNHEEILAGYASLAFKVKEKHSLKIGLRVENTTAKGKNNITNVDFKQDYIDFFPFLFYGYDVDDESSISFNYSRRIGRPSFKSLNPFVYKENDFMFQIGNPNLKPDYTDKVEVGYYKGNHSFSIYNDYVSSIREDVFYVEDQISYMQPQNFGFYDELGFDYSYGGGITEKIYFNVGTGVYQYWFNHKDYNNQMFSFYNSLFTQYTINEKTAITLSSYYSSPFQSTVSEFKEQFNSSFAIRRKFLKDKALFQLIVNDIFNTYRDKNISTYTNFEQSFWQKRRTQSLTFKLTIKLDNQRKVSDKTINAPGETKDRL